MLLNKKGEGGERPTLVVLRRIQVQKTKEEKKKKNEGRETEGSREIHREDKREEEMEGGRP